MKPKSMLVFLVLLALVAVVQSMDIEEPKLLQYVDKPYNVTFSSLGEASVNFEGSYILSIDGYRKVCLEVGPAGSFRVVNGVVYGTSSNETLMFDVVMGKLSNNTLGDEVGNGTADGHIYSYDVIGPEMILNLRGAPNTTTQVQLWLYLIP
jgi:hypothetical protein